MTPKEAPRDIAQSLEAEPPNVWRWRRVRDIGVSVGLWPLNWHFGLRHDGDYYGGSITLNLGPLYVRVDGNAAAGALGQYENEVEP